MTERNLHSKKYTHSDNLRLWYTYDTLGATIWDVKNTPSRAAQPVIVYMEVPPPGRGRVATWYHRNTAISFLRGNNANICVLCMPSCIRKNINFSKQMFNQGASAAHSLYKWFCCLGYRSPWKNALHALFIRMVFFRPTQFILNIYRKWATNSLRDHAKSMQFTRGMRVDEKMTKCDNWRRIERNRDVTRGHTPKILFPSNLILHCCRTHLCECVLW